MSLVGNLEDLGLGEILQIVSLSRRSGVLSLESRGRQARIYFHNGQVIRATSTTFQQNLGEILISKGIVDLPLVRRAVQLQADEGHRQLLGCILIDHFEVSHEAVEEVVREQIENVVYSLFLWAEGVFEFDLQEVPEFDTIFLDPLQFMLKQGLNPQYLAMEGARILDELRHKGQSGDQAARAQLKREEADDNLDLAFQPTEGRPALQTAPAAVELPPPLRAASPLPGPGAAPAVAQAAIPPALELGLVNLGDELRLELGEDLSEESWEQRERPGQSQLRAMLEELNNQQLGGGIMLLVLRFAADFLNRAVVLMVKKESIVGLGQFGLEDKDGSADRRIRNLRIPKGESSLFSPALETRRPHKGGIDDSPWSDLFLAQLGKARPVEVFVAPIMSEGKVVALLYGDNLPEMKPVGETEPLEIFLGQAGIAMEKALLQRRLQEQGRDVK